MTPATDPEFFKKLAFPHKNAFGGFTFGPYTDESGNNPPATLVRVVMQFRSNLLDETLASVIQTISSDDIAEIEITNAVTWEGIVKRQQLDDVPIGENWCGVEFEDSDGNFDCLMEGKIPVTPRPVLPVT
jgi:hypothetical protein